MSTTGSGTRAALVLALGIKGTFDAVMRTLGVFDYAPYDVSIPSVSLSQDGKNSWRASLTLMVGSVPGTATSTKAVISLRSATSTILTATSTATTTKPRTHL